MQAPRNNTAVSASMILIQLAATTGMQAPRNNTAVSASMILIQLAATVILTYLYQFLAAVVHLTPLYNFLRIGSFAFSFLLLSVLQRNHLQIQFIRPNPRTRTLYL